MYVFRFLWRKLDIFMSTAHTNAIQMIMTLKLMGLAFEVHETHKNELEKKHKSVNPDARDIFHYAFSHSGILTGKICSIIFFHIQLQGGPWQTVIL